MPHTGLMTDSTTCAWDMAPCRQPRSGKSKYCVTHKAEARERWKRMIASQDAARESRTAAHADLFARAHKAGMEAAEAVTPTTMVVERHANPLDDNSPVVERWVEPAGPCGFAWVLVRPGNSSFARWLVKAGHGRAAYNGGIQVWVSEHRQSIERKSAHAAAFAGVLREAGVKAYSQSRLD